MGRKDTDSLKIDIDNVLTEFDEINKGMIADKRAESNLKVEIIEDIWRELEGDVEVSHQKNEAPVPEEPPKKKYEEFYDEDDYADDCDDQEDNDKGQSNGGENPEKTESNEADSPVEIQINEDEKSGKRLVLIGIVLVICAALAAGGVYLFVNHRAEKRETLQSEQTEIVKMDTTAPEVVVRQDIRVAVGTELSSNEVVESMRDNADIVHIAFKENGVQEGSIDEFHVLNAATCRYDQIGEFTNILLVTDAFDNVAEIPIQISVTEDYAARVQQLTDKVIVQNAEGIDFMKDVAWDESILSVTCDSSKVNMAEPGQYPLEYTIVANDANPDANKTETVMVVTKTVEIVTPETGQSMADAGGIVYTSNNAAVEAASNENVE